MTIHPENSVHDDLCKIIIHRFDCELQCKIIVDKLSCKDLFANSIRLSYRNTNYI